MHIITLECESQPSILTLVCFQLKQLYLVFCKIKDIDKGKNLKKQPCYPKFRLNTLIKQINWAKVKLFNGNKLKIQTSTVIKLDGISGSRSQTKIHKLKNPF